MRALQLGFPALGEQHCPGHPAREMEEGETHQEVQPKTTAEQEELALVSRARGLTVEGDSWTYNQGWKAFLVQRKHHRA